MKNFVNTLADLSKAGFAVKEVPIGNESCWLVFPPHSAIEWTKDNLIYRSSIWNSEGKAVSLSWKKFFNWNEKCDITPKPPNLDDCQLINKEDGSTLIVSIYEGHLVMRTRGTHDMIVLDNGYEKDFLLQKYTKFFSFIRSFDNTDCSYVFEWETPSNRIVIDYGQEPRLVLTGIIYHDDYSYADQDLLDGFAERMELERPKRYVFDTIKDLESGMKELRGIEGICVYFNDGQDIKKVKTAEYLMLHSVKFKLGYNALVDMIYENNRDIGAFKRLIVDQFDYESLTFVEPLIDRIYEIDATLKRDIRSAFELSMQLKHSNKKEFAELVLNGGIENLKEYSPFLFKWYDLAMNGDIFAADLFKNKGMLEKFKRMVITKALSDN